MSSQSHPRTILDYHDAPTPLRILGTGPHSTAIYEATAEPACCRNIETGQPCDSFRFNGDCIHIQKAAHALLIHRFRAITQQNEYLKTRYERKTSARFPDFDAVIAHFQETSAEMACLSALFLAILYAGPATTDQLYLAVEGKFQADPRIVGAVSRSLVARGYIRAGPMVPGIRQKDHYGRKPIYVITPAGRQIITDIT